MSISPRQREILTVLSEHEQWSIGEIARALRISSPGATKMMRYLERRGFVTRESDNQDGRRVNVSLTCFGKKTLSKQKL